MRYYYQNKIEDFLEQSFDSIWAKLTAVGSGDLLQTQKHAWSEQITILKANCQVLKAKSSLNTLFLVWVSKSIL